MTPFGLSIGYLENAVPILLTIHNEPQWTLDELIHEFSSDSIRFRGNSERIIRLGLANRWIKIGLDSRVIINDHLYEYLQNEVELLREMFLLYIKETRPRWKKYIEKGTKSCKEHVSDDDIQQIFRELNLYATEPNEHILLWWNRARNFIRYENGVNNTKTGDKGETLSYHYELNRTGIIPRLAAQVDENSGYDLESVKSSDNLEPLYIEVKSSKQPWTKARMFFSLGEYKKMKLNMDQYIFHLWDLSDELNPLHLIVEANDIQQHIPKNNLHGEWTEVKIPFSAFRWRDSI